MEINTKVTGLAEITELLLRELPAAAARRPLLRASHIALESPVRDLKARYYRHNKSGSLAIATRSWTARKRMSLKGNSERFSSVQMGPKRGSLEAMAAYQQFYRSKRKKRLTLKRAALGIRHGHLIEWGTKHARPFRHLTNVANGNYTQIVAVFKREVVRGFLKAVAKKKRGAKGGP